MRAAAVNPTSRVEAVQPCLSLHSTSQEMKTNGRERRSAKLEIVKRDVNAQSNRRREGAKGKPIGPAA